MPTMPTTAMTATPRVTLEWSELNIQFLSGRTGFGERGEAPSGSILLSKLDGLGQQKVPDEHWIKVNERLRLEATKESRGFAAPGALISSGT